MILAAPPAAAMTYVNDSSGLDPSVYGGGGSPSSGPFPEGSPFLSRESAALVSAITDGAAGEADAGDSSKGGAGAKAGRHGVADSVTAALIRSSSASGTK
jgi:hypothetical protein